jgi:hypothetical protein
MSALLRCRACGYVMNESNKSQVCPACGVKRAAFEPYKETVSSRRLFILNQHLHGIAVNFPQSLVALLFLSLVMGTLCMSLEEPFSVIVRAIGTIFPFAVAGGIVTGMIDGRIRFRRLVTPILRAKMAIGAVALGLSMGIFFLSRDFSFAASSPLALIVLSLCAMGCGVTLAKLGASLVCTRVPG